jgi:hypothetical protein
MLVKRRSITDARGMPCCCNPFRLAQDTVQSLQPAGRPYLRICQINTKHLSAFTVYHTKRAGQAQVDLHPARGMPCCRNPTCTGPPCSPSSQQPDLFEICQIKYLTQISAFAYIYTKRAGQAQVDLHLMRMPYCCRKSIKACTGHRCSPSSQRADRI